MNKKLFKSIAVLSTSMLLFTGCNNKKEETKKPGANEKITLNIFQFKAEIAKDLEALAKEYQKENKNVTVKVQTVGGGADYGAALKAQFASGNEPDIFNNGGYQEAVTWKDKLEDLSDQDWVKDLYPETEKPMTVDGKLLGMPMNTEGYGFIYNKDLFDKAGITQLPKTLTELEATAKKLKDAGITPFSVGYGEWWILGIHLLNIPFAQQPDPDKFIADLNAGKVKIPDNDKFKEFIKLFDLTIKYGNKNPLTTDYNTQVTNFASGKTAMMQQGNWTQGMIDGITPNMKLGLLPMPINDDKNAMDKIPVGVPNNWVVNKNSKNKEEAKKFLNWMVSSDTGKKYIVEKFKFIPAVKTIEGKGLGPIADDIQKYSAEGKVLSWNWFKYPNGATNEFGASMQAYVGGQKNPQQLLQSLQDTWDKLKKQ
ncbi:ABC transporter substrate-binding protein [Bacillus sp. UNCCL81]|uniref:ABC transporter substrate-binding protein n=1 Tax=Bacillus sp. UNCCL81 TaxID=1502755 RepID=UPI0003F826C4|nr:ABC transporter substrate-binding protein [Bacillus sp. UNCCL81]SFD09307.1 raffinose/stachyose/melibiose transport system substrate-binding protein [Bacillus sp. UNCCL81]